MTLLIKDEAHHLLLECWAEHHEISNGYRPKLFQHPIPKKFFVNGGKQFSEDKPIEFITIDNLLTEFAKTRRNPEVMMEIITYADNRMNMGDFRYGQIRRQSLGNYDIKIEFTKRFDLAYEHNSLEYLVDAYNMVRIQYYIDKKLNDANEKLRVVGQAYLVHSLFDGWELQSIDDGHHAECK